MPANLLFMSKNAYIKPNVTNNFLNDCRINQFIKPLLQFRRNHVDYYKNQIEEVFPSLLKYLVILMVYKIFHYFLKNI